MSGHAFAIRLGSETARHAGRGGQATRVLFRGQPAILRKNGRCAVLWIAGAVTVSCGPARLFSREKAQKTQKHEEGERKGECWLEEKNSVV
jgi:hypothetical protein